MASRRTLRDEDLRLNIILDGKQVPRENKKLLSELGKLERAGMQMERQYSQLAKKQKELQALEKKGTNPGRVLQLKAIAVQMKALDDAMRDNAKQQKDMRNQIGLTGMTLNQLRTHLHLLQIEQANMRGDKKMWNELQKEIDKTNYQIKKLTTNSSWLGMLWDDLAKKANKYGAAIAAIGMVVYEVTDFIGQFTSDLRELEDNMAGVRRTTDLTREQVIELKKAFDQMDTRTSANDLLEIAKVAGRLGINGKANILAFTDAMNILNVAIGEDLMQEGEGSVEDVAKAVGKLVQNFHIDDELPLNEALLRTGSVLNQLDKSSTASAGNILEFTSRLSAVAPSVKMAMSDIAGIGAYLDSAGVSAEMSSTAMQRFLLKMGSNAKEYSKIMGITTEEYSRMVNEDINEAMLRLITSATGSKQGVEQLAQAMVGLDLNEQRAIQTVMKLSEGLKKNADGTDEIRIQQEIAREAFKSSDSVMKEYAITNENFTAQLEKQEKRVTALRNSVGMELEPAVLAVKKAYVDLLYVLSDISKWLLDHWKMVAAAAIAFVTYKVNVLLASRGLVTFRAVLMALSGPLDILRLRWMYFMDGMRKMPNTTAKVGYAFKALWTIIKANPIIFIASAIGALVAAFVLLNRKVLDTNKIVKDFRKAVKDIRKDTDDALLGEQAKLSGLFDELKRNYADIEKRKSLISQINQEYGGYIKNINLEKATLEELNRIQSQANDLLLYNMANKMLADESSALNMQGLKSEKEIFENFRDATKDAGLTAEETGKAYQDLYNLTGKMEMFEKLGINMGDVFKLWKTGAMDSRVEINKLFKEKGWDAKKDFYDPISSLGLSSKQYQGNVMETLANIYTIREETKASTKDIEDFYKTRITTLENITKAGKMSLGGEEDGDGGNEGDKDKKDRIAKEQEANELWLKNEQLQLMIAQRKKGETEEWFNNQMLEKEKIYIKKMLAIKGLEGKEIVDLKIQQLENEDKITEAERAKNLAELEAGYKDKVAEIEKWHQEELKAGHGDDTEYKQLLATAELMYMNDQMMFAKNEEEKLKIKADFVKKQTELLEMLNKAREDGNKQATAGAKQVKNEYRKDLNDELKYLKEFGKLFEDTVLGNVILLRRQLEANEQVYQEDLTALVKSKIAGNITEEKFNELKASLDAEKLKKEEQMTSESQMRTLQKSMAIGEEMATNVANRYADRLKQEAALQEQLKNGEITQLEYQKKVTELRKRNQKQFLKDMLVMLIKSLQAAATAYIVEAAAASFAAHAKEGWIGIATGAAQAAALTAAINIPFEIAKAKLQATQFAAGKYPVMGADDGRTYNAQYIGKPKTGIYNGPKMALFNENPRMPELVVDGLTTKKLMFNYPDIYSSILALSGKRPMKQFAEGQYPQTALPTDSNRANSDAQMVATLELVAMELGRLRANGVNANVDIYQIDKSLTEIYRRREVAKG